MMTKNDLLKVSQDILAASPFKETEISVQVGESALTRYGDNRISQNVSQENTSVSLRGIVRGGQGARTARVETDQIDAKSVARAYERLEKILDVLPASEVADLHASGDRYVVPERRAADVAEPEFAAQAVQKAVRMASDNGFQSSGTFSSDRQNRVYANSTGLQLANELSDSEFACTIEGSGGAGRGFSNRADAKELKVDASVKRALEKCKFSSQGLESVTPGNYDVVLEPAALAEVLVFFGWIGLSAKGYLENRVFCKGKLGEKLFDERVTLLDDPLNPEIGGSYFDGQGVAKHRVTFVQNGVLKELANDLKTARQLKRAPTGHGIEEPNASDPIPWNIGLDWSGDRAADTTELVSRVKRGILVTQFHYTNLIDVMIPSLTGMTRNGTFLIEDGKITKPIRNMRFMQSMTEFFNNVDAVSREQERASTFFGGASLAPSVLVRKFHFSSGTEF
ncbi:MAG: TldD/PmbA family protein [Deltaproteobacteria bacterium]|nr:TldD/PmbA family protein [Deltaproteobacteria bacterium]